MPSFRYIFTIFILLLAGCDTGQYASSQTNEDEIPSREFVTAEGFTTRMLSNELPQIGQIGHAYSFDDKVYVSDQGNGTLIHVLKGNGEYEDAIHLQGKTISEPGPLVIQDGIYIADNETQNVEAFDLTGKYIKSIPFKYPSDFGMPHSRIVDMEILDNWLYLSDQGGKNGISRVNVLDGQSVEPILFPWIGNLAVKDGILYLSASMNEGNSENVSASEGNEIVATASDGFIARVTENQEIIKLFSFTDGYMPCDFLVRNEDILVVSGSWNVVDRYESSGTYIDTPANLNRNMDVNSRFGEVIQTGNSSYMLVLYYDHEIIVFEKVESQE